MLNGLLVGGALIGVPFVGLVPSPGESYALDQLTHSSERTLVLLTDSGAPFARRGGCTAEPVRLSEVPRHFIDALLSMEDRRFYSHPGLDPLGILRAAYRNWQAGAVVEGGSTITQQLVKFSFLSNARTISRKQKEALLALWLELQLSKTEILQRYLNSAYFGEACFGLRAAARHYFSKRVGDLSLSESAFLVALLKAPTALSQDFEAATSRADLVLQAMIDNGRITEQEVTTLSPAKPHREKATRLGGYYADWVAHAVDTSKSQSLAPLVLHTSFNERLQQLAEQSVQSVLAEESEKRNVGQAAMVVMRTDGRVVAMVGGQDYSGSRFNRAVQARRQPGSSFKLFVYLAALRAGLDLNAHVVDEPISIGDYEPENFGNRYRGSVSIRQAFASSINSVAVRLSEAVGRNEVIAAAEDLGISTPLEATPSVALGAWETTLLDMTSAYCAVAAGAYPIKPWAIVGIGSSAPAAALPPEESGRWRLEKRKELLTLLEATVRYGSGRSARLPIKAFGKTGTSQEYRDAWFIGFAGNLVAGVWVGNDESGPMQRVTGGSLPAQIWHRFMTDALQRDPYFEREQTQVAAFPAKHRERKNATQLVMEKLQSDHRRTRRAMAGGESEAPLYDPSWRRRRSGFRNELRAIPGWPGWPGRY